MAHPPKSNCCCVFHHLQGMSLQICSLAQTMSAQPGTGRGGS